MKYKSLAAIIIIAAFLVAASGNQETKTPGKSSAGAGQEDKPQSLDLRWKFGDEKSFTYNYTETFKMNMKGESDSADDPSLNKDRNVETAGTITIKSTGGGDKAELNINLVITEKADELGQSPSFDSKENTRERNMDITAMVLPDGAIELEEENLAAHASVQSMMDKLYVMPSNPEVSPGDSWEKDMDYLTRMSPSTSGKVNTTFLGWTQEEGGRYAEFENHILIEMEQARAGAEQTTTITGDGTWRFDPSAGKVVQSNLDYTLNMEMYMDIPPEKDPDGVGKSIDITANGEGKVELTQKDF